MIKTLTNLFKQDKEKFVVPKGAFMWWGITRINQSILEHGFVRGWKRKRL